jgi:hypothetical protein
VLVKNINSTHRIEGIQQQFGLSGALKAGKDRLLKGQNGSAANGHVKNMIKSALTD